MLDEIIIPRIITFELGNGDTAFKMENLKTFKGLSKEDIDQIMDIADEVGFSIADVDDDPDFGIRLQCYAEPMTTEINAEFKTKVGKVIEKVMSTINF